MGVVCESSPAPCAGGEHVPHTFGGGRRGVGLMLQKDFFLAQPSTRNSITGYFGTLFTHQ